MRRTGSCDRLATRSPRAILQLGSEPFFLADAVRNFETDSSFSLPLLHPPASLPLADAKQDLEADIELAVPHISHSPMSPTSRLIEPDVLVAAEPASSSSAPSVDPVVNEVLH